jgi:hypothetical protein
LPYPRITQPVRIIALLALLAASAPARTGTANPLATLDLGRVWGTALLLTVIAGCFVAVALWKRDDRHPWPVLVGEGITAGVLALTPPVAWVRLLGAGDLAGILGGTTGDLYVQALAAVWLAVVAATTLRQSRPRVEPPGRARW